MPVSTGFGNAVGAGAVFAADRLGGRKARHLGLEGPSQYSQNQKCEQRRHGLLGKGHLGRKAKPLAFATRDGTDSVLPWWSQSNGQTGRNVLGQNVATWAGARNRSATMTRGHSRFFSCALGSVTGFANEPVLRAALWRNPESTEFGNCPSRPEREPTRIITSSGIVLAFNRPNVEPPPLSPGAEIKAVCLYIGTGKSGPEEGRPLLDSCVPAP